MSSSSHFPTVVGPNFAPAVEPRTAAMDHLRAFLTLLVVAHHAVLAYHPYAPTPAGFTAENPWWGAFPVVDPARWPGVEVFTMWNDAFFMALMFFLSGLFVWTSLGRKGAGGFLRGRLWRLGIPFAVGAAFLAPLAYYPAFAVAGGGSGLGAFWAKWMLLGFWPAGPVWFLWVLLAFSGVAAGLHAAVPGAGAKLAAFGVWASERPWRGFVLLSGAALLAYLPMTVVVNPYGWDSWGPFSVQTVRVPLYAVYFCFGVAMGAAGLERGWLAPGGALARRWMLWNGMAGVPFVLFVGAMIVVMTTLQSGTYRPIFGMTASAAFVLSGVTTSFALMAAFLRWCPRPFRAGTSLSANAYGMYLFHYAIVSWLQLSLLPVGLPGAAKGLIVIAGAIGLSYVVTATLRRIPLVARML